MIRVPVQTAQRPYEVFVGGGLLEGMVALTGALCPGRRAVIVSDENVAPLYMATVRAALQAGACAVTEIVLPAGEEQKRLARVEEMYGVLYERHITRADVVVALGGGVIGDLAGFVAATYLRGVPLVQVPTTLLAQVDAAVGGKVGVDFRAGKNHVGTFYQPRAVVADADTLRSLPLRERRNGAAEVVKYALLAGGETLDLVRRALAASPREHDPVALCVEEIVAPCVRYKARVVAADEREETGERHLLNLGHTIGHALESAGGFSLYSHGEAVGLGLRAALWLSRRLCGLDDAGFTLGMELLDAVGAPARSAVTDTALVTALVGRDKKAAGADVPFVLLAAFGSPVRGVSVRQDLIEEVVEWLRA